MEMMILLAVIAAAAILMMRHGKSKPAGERVSAVPVPEKKNAMPRELTQRVEEFMQYDRFSLVIQPMVNLSSNTSNGGVVLSRLNHPERGVIFPNDFLPCIEAAGLESKFDRYIFRKTCAWLSRSLAAGETVECISCNFSRKTLSEPDIVPQLLQITDSFSFPCEKLGIEITERDKEMDSRQFLENLKRLKEAGFRIILDDCGIGVTSVKDLPNYPLDVVKIDRSILCAADTEQKKSAYRALVSMAAELGLKVVCKGIETEAQDAFARDVGCNYGQGFLYFTPMDVDKMFQEIEKSRVAEDAV